jgi:3-oxoacyl-[acyl-carrier protein] reductase
LKVALITGASGGIGRETAIKFAKNGYFVIAQYNTNKNGIDSLISTLSEQGVKDMVFGVQADFTDLNSIDNMMAIIGKSFKHIDVLVNNAGTGLYKLITQTSVSEWKKVFDVNVTSIYYLTNLVLNGMIDAKKGKIINVSSIWGNSGASMEVAYSASKSAVIGYTKALAKEVAPSKINVNCVCPGVIDTPINARFSYEDMQVLKEETPLGRIGEPTDISELVYFLADEKSDFITGQVVACDGGFSL